MSEERLAVSTAGMRELHADRLPWTLVKELVQNAWDEAPAATVCHVDIQPLRKGRDASARHALIEVSDDGPGFRNVADAYTLMGPTAKRSDPRKRGRFNIGEKELLSICIEGEIETVGQTVQFPQAGGRKLHKNSRTRGTVVKLTMPWKLWERENVRDALRRFQPPANCRLVLIWGKETEEIERRKPTLSRKAELPTVLQDGPGLPMRHTTRVTSLDILERVDPDNGWLYEMGIPIQKTDLAYDVDVQQKVPMPPNRDTVGVAYLRDISAEVLNAAHELMDGDQFAASWVRSALEDNRIERAAVQTTVKERYGDKVAIWSSNTDANMKAAEAGYEVLHPRSMSPEERTHMKDLGGLVSTHDIFGRELVATEPVEPNDIQSQWALWVKTLGKQCGLDVTPAFYRLARAGVAADCTANTKTPTVGFNLAKLSDEWLAQRGREQVTLLVHEFGHAVACTPMEHGPRWGEACCKVAGRLWEQMLAFMREETEA